MTGLKFGRNNIRKCTIIQEGTTEGRDCYEYFQNVAARVELSATTLCGSVGRTQLALSLLWI